MPARGRVRKRWSPGDIDGSLTVELPDGQDPPDWNAIFGRPGPLHVEIGFGKGDFLEALARIEPAARIVGVEIKRHLVHWVEVKLLRENISAVRLVEANARWQVGRLFPAASVDAFYFNFPDPWPKVRHAKRRLLHPGLAAALERFLRPGGVVTAVSDVEAYALVARESFAGHPAFRLAGSADWTERVPSYPETIHERKFRAAGRTIYFVRAQKIDGSVYSP